jgi:hypothetical protein
MGIIAKQDDEETAHQDEKGSAGRMRDLQLIATGDEFSAIPEAAGWLHSKDKDAAGNYTHDPAYHVVHSVKIHITLILNDWQMTHILRINANFWNPPILHKCGQLKRLIANSGGPGQIFSKQTLITMNY